MSKANFDTDEFRDHVSTISADGKRVWLYPKQPKGRFTEWRYLTSYVYLAIFLALPFIKWKGEPFFMLNVIERKFILWGWLFTPQDFHLFALVFLTGMVFVILFTVVFGRLFCGWACPQTIFMELIFRRIEYAIEGDAGAQKRLNEGPMTPDKLRKKTLKHVLFFAISVIVANWFLAYIIGMDEVKKIAFEPLSQHMGGFAAMLLFSALFYGVFAFMREQVCTTICPYGRMQGVLLVKDSIVVAYDFVRGEPRGKLKKEKETPAPAQPALVKTGTDGMAFSLAIFDEKATEKGHHHHEKHADGTTCTGKCGDCKTKHESLENPKPEIQIPKSLGDCIDCKLCIQVCPTGIDIRNGTQLECVNCTACIDACDEVMDKIQKPRGLIRYDSLSSIEAKKKRQIFTPRVWAYSAVLAALVGLDIFLFSRRSAVEAIILRAPGQLFQERGVDSLSNLYSFELINKTTRSMPVRLVLEGEKGTIRTIGAWPDSVAKGSTAKGAFFIDLPKTALTGRKTHLKIQVLSGSEVIDVAETNFLGPGR